MVPRISAALRQHLFVFAVLTILIVAMTFPTIKYVFNSEVFWLPTGDHSYTWMKFWDVWYGWCVLDGEADIRHTDLIFFPQDVSLRFHSFSFTHMLLFRDVICVDDSFNGFGLAVEDYLVALDRLERDGFSHVVFHRNLGHGFSIRKSFLAAEPTYSDDIVSVYRLDDLRASCQVGRSWWAKAG